MRIGRSRTKEARAGMVVSALFTHDEAQPSLLLQLPRLDLILQLGLIKRHGKFAFVHLDHVHRLPLQAFRAVDRQERDGIFVIGLDLRRLLLFQL
jgi:hypothetical protein